MKFGRRLLEARAARGRRVAVERRARQFTMRSNIYKNIDPLPGEEGRFDLSDFTPRWWPAREPEQD